MAIDDPDWRNLIIGYLKSPLAGADSQLAKLKIKVAIYILINEVLFKRSFTLSYLRCLRSDETEYALRKIHKRIRGQYISG